jgi:hypothetical protein
MGKHFIDPKSSEILSIFQVFPCTMQAMFTLQPKMSYISPKNIIRHSICSGS